jgi:hypothetical protein
MDLLSPSQRIRILTKLNKQQNKTRTVKVIVLDLLVATFITVPLFTIGTILSLSLILAWLGIPIIALGALTLVKVDKALTKSTTRNSEVPIDFVHSD